LHCFDLRDISPDFDFVSKAALSALFRYPILFFSDDFYVAAIDPFTFFRSAISSFYPSIKQVTEAG